MSEIVDFFEDFGDTVKDAAGGVFGGLKDVVGNLGNTFKGLFGRILGGGGGGSDDMSTYLLYGGIAIGIIVLAVVLKKMLF